MQPLQIEELTGKKTPVLKILAIVVMVAMLGFVAFVLFGKPGQARNNSIPLMPDNPADSAASWSNLEAEMEESGDKLVGHQEENDSNEEIILECLDCVDTSTAPASPEAPAKPASPAPAGLPKSSRSSGGQYLNKPAGNIQTRTELQAEYEELSLLVKIAEEEDKLNKLSAPVSAPSVNLPPTSAKTKEPDKTATAVEPSSGPIVVAVQGIDGKLVARVATSSGVKTLKVGDTFGLGQVERISVDGVHIRAGETSELLAVEE